MTQGDVEKVWGPKVRGDSRSVPQVPDNYTTAVVKLIPAEIIAAWLAIDSLLSLAPGAPPVLDWIILAGLTAFAALYVWHASSEPDLRRPYIQTAVSTSGFVVWIFAIGGPFATLDWYSPVYGGLLLIFFALGLPLVMKGR